MEKKQVLEQQAQGVGIAQNATLPSHQAGELAQASQPIAASSNAGEQHYPSTGDGSALSAIMQQERDEPGKPSSAPLQVPSLPSLQQSMEPATPKPPPLGKELPGSAPLPQHGGPRRRGVRSKGMIALLIGLAFLIIMGSVSFLLYANWQATNREHAAATATAQINATATAQAKATFLASHYPFSDNLVFRDPMSDYSIGLGWTASTDKEAIQFIGGALHLKEADKAQIVYSVALNTLNTTFSNFTYEIQMTIIKGDKGGIMFPKGGGKHSFWVFTISSDGSYDLYIRDSDHRYSRLIHGSSAAINTGLNQSNLIAAVVRGGRVDLYVNGNFVNSVEPLTLDEVDAPAQGPIGVVAIDVNNPTEVAFRNAKVWELPKNS